MVAILPSDYGAETDQEAFLPCPILPRPSGPPFIVDASISARSAGVKKRPTLGGRESRQGRLRPGDIGGVCSLSAHEMSPGSQFRVQRSCTPYPRQFSERGCRGLRRRRNHVSATDGTGFEEPSGRLPSNNAWLLRFAPQPTAPDPECSEVDNRGKVAAGREVLVGCAPCLHTRCLDNSQNAPCGRGISVPTYHFARALLQRCAQSRCEKSKISSLGPAALWPGEHISIRAVLARKWHCRQ